MQHLEGLLDSKDFIGKSFSSNCKTYTVDKADNFSYVDPIDHSVAKNQVQLNDFKIHLYNWVF